MSSEGGQNPDRIAGVNPGLRRYRLKEERIVTNSNALVKMVEESGLPQTKSQQLLEQFTEYFRIAAEWENKSKEIVVTDASQTELIAQARGAWLTLREYRINLEKTRKALKDESWREGKTIDNIANVLKSLIEPSEKHLEKQAKFVEFRQKELDEKRRKEADRLLQEKEEADQKIKDQEIEDQRLENERLKKEADEKDQIHRQEQALLEAKAAAEREKFKKKVAADRKKADERLQKERDKTMAEQKKKDEAARIERDRLKAEKEKAEAEKRAAMSNYEKLLKFVREIEAEDFICGHCEGQCSDADSRAADVLQEIGEE